MDRKLKTLLTLSIVVMLNSTAFAQSPVSMAKVSPHLMDMVNGMQKANGDRRVQTLSSLTVSCDTRAFFERHGCRLIDSIGHIYIVSIPLDRVAELSNNDTVARLEAERMPRPVSATEVEPKCLIAPMDVKIVE